MTLTAQDQIGREPPTDGTPDLDQRGDGRMAMFVSAGCVVHGRAQPVRIRNMSRNGVLLEGAALPAEGMEFDLVRGQLHVRATCMWTRGNLCGAQLLSHVDVTIWMARSARHQQRVDAMVHEARLAIAAGKEARVAGPRPSSNQASIQAAITLLEDLEAALAEDDLVVARHLDRLQSLDRALQLLRLAAPGANAA